MNPIGVNFPRFLHGCTNELLADVCFLLAQELFARGVSGVGVLFQSAEELRHRQHYPQPGAK